MTKNMNVGQNFTILFFTTVEDAALSFFSYKSNIFLRTKSFLTVLDCILGEINVRCQKSYKSSELVQIFQFLPKNFINCIIIS